MRPVPERNVCPNDIDDIFIPTPTHMQSRYWQITLLYGILIYAIDSIT
jgi:hypothetical protein